MLLPSRFSGISRRPNIRTLALLVLAACTPPASAQSAYVRVNQIGYEAGSPPFRAYLMSTASESGAIFTVLNSQGAAVYSASIGALLGTWSNSASLTYDVYALDFAAPAGEGFTISVSGPAAATSPVFPVGAPDVLYPGLLLNTLWFYQTDRDGPDFIPNALRTAPGHLNDESASVYETPPLDENDNINTTSAPLTPNGAVIDAAGGWWDAGDYMKYVETVSYTLALMEIGIRDFPNQMGPNAPIHPPAPPNSISYAGNASGTPLSSNFTAEALFGIDWLMKMWNDDTKTLYYQVDNSQDWAHFPSLFTEYDIWTLPQAADHYDDCNAEAYYICYRPVFLAAPAGSPISPNLAGRLVADFAVCYQLNRATNLAFANQCLKNAEDIFALANTSFPDPAPSVGSGNCPSCLLTILPFDGYPETVWDDDMELGATELYFALQSAGEARDLPPGLLVTNSTYYLKQAAQFAHNYVSRIYNTGSEDTLNLYDVSGLAHFELYRALGMAGNPSDVPLTQSQILDQLRDQVAVAITQSATDAWGFGVPWQDGDTTSHGAGLSVMASELAYATNLRSYNTYSQRWLANILGANPWGSSFIIGDGSETFTNCPQHQVANLAGALDGTSGATPILWGAATEGPASYASSGTLTGMLLCPANRVDPFQPFNGNDGEFRLPEAAVYRDNVQSYSTTEPAIDLTSTSFLMWSWRMAARPSRWATTSTTVSSPVPVTVAKENHHGTE
jgi:endoglucanase